MEVESHINNTLGQQKGGRGRLMEVALSRGIKYSSLLTNKSVLWKVAA